MWVRLLAILAALAVAASAYALAQTPISPPVAAPAPSEVAAQPASPPPPAPRHTRPPKPGAREPAAPPASEAPRPPRPTPPPAAPIEPSQGEAELRAAARLQRLAEGARIGGTLGIAVFDGAGRAVFGHQETTPVLPASTQKLAVAGAALARFGPQHRYTTTVTTTAAPDARGVLKGNLVIVGGGDPALAQPDFAAVEPDRPRTPLEQLVTGIKRAGIRRVQGRLLADPTFFAQEPAAVGWPPRYFEYLDATRITGLTVDAGRRIYRSGGSLQAEAAEDPARQTATVLRQLLRARGVKVGGIGIAPRSIPPGTTVATVKSPPLGRMLQYMVQRSDNHLADTIFRTLGAAVGDPTWIGAAGATADTLAPLRLDWNGIVLADGSGLSRANRVTPSFLAQLQAHLWSSNLREQWVQLLAVAGRSGTLRSRLVGTVAEQRVYGKTGSLRDVTALVGTVAGTEGRLLHFAIVGNELESSTPIREVTDASVLAMAEEIQDCRRVRRPPRIRGKGKHRTVVRFPPRLVCG